MATQHPNLPDDIAVNVLLILPVKSLLRFKCVSKSWRSLITDPLFVKQHLKRAYDPCNTALCRFGVVGSSCPSAIKGLINLHSINDDASDRPVVRADSKSRALWGLGYDSCRDDYLVVHAELYARRPGLPTINFQILA
ncbi:hypothetical protein RJ639_007025 [Escallonia herrerae]|uniref:F-box domain-containing protein n=1 Tax=Escallonia herrerae TaxID=1293975 RepID=A0AA89AUX6_9ASTE|nr:hypothetical protein RJ639_007025 [Escallonia herrerae]